VLGDALRVEFDAARLSNVTFETLTLTVGEAAYFPYNDLLTGG